MCISTVELLVAQSFFFCFLTNNLVTGQQSTLDSLLDPSELNTGTLTLETPNSCNSEAAGYLSLGLHSYGIHVE